MDVDQPLPAGDIGIINQIGSGVNDLKQPSEAVKSMLNQIDYDKFIENPWEYIQQLFDAKASIFPPVDCNTWQSRILQALHLKHVERRLKTQAVAKIPSLNDPNTDKVSNGMIVSFRCIIQDDLDHEVVPSELAVKNVAGQTIKQSTLLRDVTEIETEFDTLDTLEFDFHERDIFIGVTPPGENAWVTVSKMETKTKGLGVEPKRIKIDVEESGVDGNSKLIDLPDCAQLFRELFLNIGDSKPVACILKIYGSDLKPNDLVEVTGIIELKEPRTATDRNKELLIGMLEKYPNFTKLPKLFVFSCLKLADGNPQVPVIEDKLFPLVPHYLDMNFGGCVQKQVLRDILTYALGGDRTAAVFTMVALAARIIHRVDSGHGPIGKYVLNLSGIPASSDIPETFQYVIKRLIPRCLLLNLTIPDVNSWKLTPRKDPQTNQLETGLFQMASGTHVVINETGLEVGEFDDAGRHNIVVLKEMLTTQQVKYDYTYQFPALPVDSPVFVLSDTSSVLPVDLRIPVMPDNKLTLEERRSRIEQLMSEWGSQLQTYLSVIRSVSLESHEVFSDKLSEDFVEFFRVRNQTDGFHTKMSSVQFSTFITSCRLWGILNGELSISRDSLMFWKDLEIIRDQRVGSSVTKSGRAKK